MGRNMKISVVVEESELQFLKSMVESNDAASISHAVRKCIDKAQRGVLKA
jgi:Arc/MetJ-type ribon-helix-helix transcriptional regulator